MALSSDFIVGFPGESDDGFRSDAASWSKRSAMPRPIPSNTAPGPARRQPIMAQQVPEDVKAERLERLQALLRRQQADLQSPRCVGRTLPVLFERAAAMQASSWAAVPICRPVHVASPRPDRRDLPTSSSTPWHPNSLAGRAGRLRGPICIRAARGGDVSVRSQRRPCRPPPPRRNPFTWSSTTTACCPCCSANTTRHLARIEQQLGVSLVSARQSPGDLRPAGLRARPRARP